MARTSWRKHLHVKLCSIRAYLILTTITTTDCVRKFGRVPNIPIGMEKVLYAQCNILHTVLSRNSFFLPIYARLSAKVLGLKLCLCTKTWMWSMEYGSGFVWEASHHLLQKLIWQMWWLSLSTHFTIKPSMPMMKVPCSALWLIIHTCLSVQSGCM